jgi:hypothetical protein
MSLVGLSYQRPTNQCWTLCYGMGMILLFEMVALSWKVPAPDIESFGRSQVLSRNEKADMSTRPLNQLTSIVPTWTCVFFRWVFPLVGFIGPGLKIKFKIGATLRDQDAYRISRCPVSTKCTRKLASGDRTPSICCTTDIRDFLYTRPRCTKASSI